MDLINHPLYTEDIRYAAELPLPWEKLEGTAVLISGASGLIGSCLVDVLVRKNEKDSLNCRIYAVGRNAEKAKERFSYCWNKKYFRFIRHDIRESLDMQDAVGYAVHLASNTHPIAYSTDPIGTIMTNITGTQNMLNVALNNHADRFVFASSNEIYGENRGDTELFDEKYCGYIDSNTLRAGYPESKRCGEALCQAYLQQYGMDVVIPRFTRSYGPSMLSSDSKAISQFMKRAAAGEDIVLKSEGNQYYSYTYMMDAVTGLLTVMLKGETGEAYNISDQRSDIKLKDLAALIAGFAGKQVVFNMPGETEKAGYSKATKARLSPEKIQELGWRARYTIEEGTRRTLAMLKDCTGNSRGIM